MLNLLVAQTAFVAATSRPNSQSAVLFDAIVIDSFGLRKLTWQTFPAMIHQFKLEDYSWL